jgi:hypothetical protein
MPKNSNGTPNSKNQLNNSKAYNTYFIKVLKTGGLGTANVTDLPNFFLFSSLGHPKNIFE